MAVLIKVLCVCFYWSLNLQKRLKLNGNWNQTETIISAWFYPKYAPPRASDMPLQRLK